MKDVHIVIVNYNVRHFLSRCLDSILNADLEGLNVKIWVVDNNSIDGTVPFLQHVYPFVNVIANTDNRGFSKANNQALRLIQDGYILILNPDTLIQNDTLQKCISLFESKSDIGAIGVKMIDGSGRFLPESKRGIPNLWNSFCKFSGIYRFNKSTNFLNGYYAGQIDENNTDEIDVLCGAFMFTEKKVLDKSGLFDEDFFMYGEDIDLSIRIKNAGYKIMYYPDTCIVHFKGESTKKVSFDYIRSFYSAMAIFAKKHYTGLSGVLYRIFINLAIFVLAAFSWLKNIISFLLIPLIDGGIAYLAINTIKSYWAKFQFHNENYYTHSHFNWVSLVYIAVIIYCIWFFGFYEKMGKLKHALTGTLLGGAILLIVYGLLPIEWRSSRALLVFTVGTTCIGVVVSKWLRIIINKYLSKSSQSKIVVVANEQNAIPILNQLAANQKDGDVVGLVSPTIQKDMKPYLNELSYLQQIINQFQISKVIFSAEDLTMKQIMSEMISPDRNVQYFIAGGDIDKGIVGSNDQKKQGTIYHLSASYRLAKSHHLRLKRLCDLILSFALIVLHSITFMVMLPLSFHNLFSVLFGKSTFVGYDKNFIFNLPEIKPSIYTVQKTDMPIQEQFLVSDKDVNQWYAMHYTPLVDLNIIVHRLTQKKS